MLRHPVIALRERLQGLADRALVRPYPEWYAADNRFRSRFRMDRAHAPIVAAACEALVAGGGNGKMQIDGRHINYVTQLTNPRPLVGPMGVPTTIGDAKKVVCVGGGLGVAPLFPQARAFHEKGATVIGILGFRTAGLMFWQYTEDGDGKLLDAINQGLKPAR